MPKLCCFLHPEYNADEGRQLDHLCPTCNRPYGFPLLTAPEQVGNDRIIKPLARGFYSVAYVAEVGTFRRKKVLKLAFKETYDFFKKDFERECREHAEIASGSQHIVGIDEMKLNVPVKFGDDEFVCHVAQMDFVDGPTLSDLLSSQQPLAGRTVAQIAIDLFSILRELANHQVHHNDLNPGNLIVEQLTSVGRRPDAEDELVRVMAIDLNSASDASRSDADAQRLGDLHWVVTYLRQLVGRLLPDPDSTSDLEYRLASVLEERSSILSAEATKQRVPSFDECIDDIRMAVRQVSSPWREPARLRRFNDAYNAQTMAAWFVPLLIVDPDDRWVSAITIAGPQVVTGMRGCGKTMLLRSLQFHARATLVNGDHTPSTILQRIGQDGYVGLYASSMRLLDTVGTRQDELRQPYTRLLLAYARESLLAVRHLREVSPEHIAPGYYNAVGKAVADWIDNADTVLQANSEHELERALHDCSVRVSRGDERFAFRGHPSEAFPALAEALRKTSPQLWANATVFFLLDDVSTRFLELKGIDELTSALLFSDTRCAFKMTTESQTLEQILRSPGQIEKAREGRDYQVFDLGAEVNAVIRSATNGKRFIENVLSQRAKLYAHHPKTAPAAILGDISLDKLADGIAASASTSRQRKSAYWGISALRGVCVGDIGDAISLYELMLRKGGNALPIKPEVQSECYQEYCSRRLYDLHRRKSDLKDYALSFAEASHELLLKSKRDLATSSGARLRQYLRLYVRVTVGDTQAQFERLRELIDSGVFVLDGGTYRTKTRDANPMRQFKLTFRKLFGLSNFIGLAERDRFELSGTDLADWLANPASGKQILLRNLISDSDKSASSEIEVDANEQAEPAQAPPPQGQLFPEPVEQPQQEPETDNTVGVVELRTPLIEAITNETLAAAGINTLVVGLGFEERTLASVERILAAVRPEVAMLVKYNEPGRGAAIEAAVRRHAGEVKIINYLDVIAGGFADLRGPILIDVTGLAKPVIFHSVRNALRDSGKVWVCRTRAAKYYPLDDEIDRVFKAEAARDSNEMLVALSSVLTGEKGPYSIDPLLEFDGDESRRRFLCAFSSPKHERLLTLLDKRSYDAVSVFTQNDSSSRSRIAQLAAEVAARSFPGAFIENLASDDLQGAITMIARVYESWYVDRGFNFEFGMTGSKLQAVACAAISSVLKVSQAWYVRPGEFDPVRFTTGIGTSAYFAIRLPTQQAST
jgi:hypothetical protein